MPPRDLEDDECILSVGRLDDGDPKLSDVFARRHLRVHANEYLCAPKKAGRRTCSAGSNASDDRRAE